MCGEATLTFLSSLKADNVQMVRVWNEEQRQSDKISILLTGETLLKIPLLISVFFEISRAVIPKGHQRDSTHSLYKKKCKP
ncbi:hypothetical protein E2C01_019121 [Portunus trituberculatus]|uniref:Uncharacterized protein n=1 Tax=Portunus trituberculatus TaxID=210409 RepID=A0A5B7DZ44_PORTR|nr:hypothetical protein [Portunus trituberculatus]